MKTFEELKENAIEQIIFEATETMGDLRNNHKAYKGMLNGFRAIFGDEEYHAIIEEVKKRTAERGLKVQEPKNA